MKTHSTSNTNNPSIKRLVIAAIVAAGVICVRAFTAGTAEATTTTGFSAALNIGAAWTEVEFDYDGNGATKLVNSDWLDGAGWHNSSWTSTASYVYQHDAWNPSTVSWGGSAMEITNPGWDWQYYHAYAYIY